MAEMPLDTLARALGRKPAELREQIERAESPEAERRRLERKAERARTGIEARAEAAWLEGQALDAAGRFQAIRTRTDAELAQRRARMSLGAQLDQALADASMLTHVSGASTEGSGHTKPGARGPGVISGALYEPGTLDVGARYRVVIGQLVANLRREVDAVVRRPLDRKLEGSAEKERRLFEHWEGVRSEVVATLDPSLGSARSIEIMRRRNGLRPVDGTKHSKSRSAYGGD